MKYDFELIPCITSGKCRPRFYCEHCNTNNLYMSARFYTATLHHQYRYHLNEACREFVSNINNRKFNMFTSKQTGKQLKSSLCHCSVNVVCIKAHKAKNKAKLLVNKGMHKLHLK